MLFPVFLGLSLRAELCIGQDHVYPTQQWRIQIVFLQPKDQQKFTLLIISGRIRSQWQKAQQHEVSKPHSGHTFIPWSPAICLLSNHSRHIHKILNTSTLAKSLEVCLEGQHAWQEKAGQSPEALGAGCVDWVLYEGEGIWEETLNLLAAQWYPRVSVNMTGGGATEGTVALTCWGWILILIHSQPVREGNWTPKCHVRPQPT